MFPTTCATTVFLSGPARVCDRHTMPARSPSVGGIHLRATGLPGTMFATLGVSTAGHLGPNSYHPSPKVTDIPHDQISTPLLWNIWFVASYQFFLKPLTNSYNQDPAPSVGNIAPLCLLLKYSNVPNRPDNPSFVITSVITWIGFMTMKCLPLETP